jgi:aminoglycoside 6'-N-acetyltransferase I
MTDPSTDRVIVRPARPGDQAAWAALRAALWPDADPEELAQEAARFFGEGLHGADAVLLAVADGGALPIGMAELSVRSHADGCTSNRVAYLEGWYVDVAWRRRGVGRALIEAAVEWARGLGIGEMASDADIDNTVSLRAHEALGFTPVSRAVTFARRIDR